MKSSLRQLKESDFGNKLFYAIALEMGASSEHDEVLTTVLEMLYTMRDSLFGYW